MGMLGMYGVRGHVIGDVNVLNVWNGSGRWIGLYSVLTAKAKPESEWLMSSRVSHRS